MLDQGADNVADGDVGFLDALGIAGRNVEEDVHFAGERAAGFSRQGDEESSAGAPSFDRFDNVWAGAAGGKSDYNVVRADERFHLAGKNAFEAVVVAGGGENGRVGGEGESGQAGA